MNLRELIAKEISQNGECAETDMWQHFCEGNENIYCQCRDTADAIIAKLMVNGLAVVPVEATKEMLDVFTLYYWDSEKQALGEPCYWLEPEDWKAMIAASPWGIEQVNRVKEIAPITKVIIPAKAGIHAIPVMILGPTPHLSPP